MKVFLIIFLFILSGCGNISNSNFDGEAIADKYLLTINDFNDTFKVINNLDNQDSNDQISSDINSENPDSRVNLIIDKAINELAECANNEVLFYSDKEAEYEGETLVGELFGGSDRVYAEINSFVYVKRGIEGELEKFTKYKK